LFKVHKFKYLGRTSLDSYLPVTRNAVVYGHDCVEDVK